MYVSHETAQQTRARLLKVITTADDGVERVAPGVAAMQRRCRPER